MPIRKPESKLPKILFGVLISLLLVASLFGFALSLVTVQTDLEYNGIEFIRIPTGIAAQIEGQIFEFTYTPDAVAGMEINESVELLTSSRTSYMTSDPYGHFPGLVSVAIADTSRALEKKHNHFALRAFTLENLNATGTNKLPVITCENATALVPVVLFQFTPSDPSVQVVGSCAVISFDSEDYLRRIHDALVYEFLEVSS